MFGGKSTDSFLIKLYLFGLHQVLVVAYELLVVHEGSSFPTRDRTQVLCIGKEES